jgi:glyoxylase-like metal-dependent hydrolase (beta-lactamase superfamily II)
MKQVADGVYRLGSDRINFYLVAEGESLTVVDTGLPGYFDQLPAGVAELGRSTGDVEAIVLTHNHSDHVGFAERLRTMGPPVYIHEVDAPGATGAARVPQPKGRVRDLLKPGIVTFLGHAMRNNGLKYPKISEVTTYADADMLDVPGHMKVVFTPGHSPGHCALLMEDRGVLISADGLVTLTPWTGESGPQLMKINADFDRARRSLDIYERLEADVLLPGHGNPWTGGVPTAARRARERSSTR